MTSKNTSVPLVKNTIDKQDIESLINKFSIHNVTKDRTYEIRSELSYVLDEYLQKSKARKQ